MTNRSLSSQRLIVIRCYAAASKVRVSLAALPRPWIILLRGVCNGIALLPRASGHECLQMPHYATRVMSASDITRERLALSPLGKSGKAKSVELLNPSGWQFAIQVPWRAHGGSLILCSPAQVLVCALVWCLAETAALARLGPRVTYSFKIKDLVLCLKWQLMTILQCLGTEMRRQSGGKWMSTRFRLPNLMLPRAS